MQAACPTVSARSMGWPPARWRWAGALDWAKTARAAVGARSQSPLLLSALDPSDVGQALDDVHASQSQQ